MKKTKKKLPKVTVMIRGSGNFSKDERYEIKKWLSTVGNNLLFEYGKYSKRFTARYY